MVVDMKYELSATEREIMDVLWSIGGVELDKVSTGEVMRIFTERGKKWKRQTLNTFFTRLEEKELIHRERGTVEPRYSKKEFQSLCCHEILKQGFDGKLSNFLCAYCGTESISEEEAQQLLKIIQKGES